MLHGIEIVCENSDNIRELLKDYDVYPLNNHFISVSFSFNCENYYSQFEKCIAALVFHNIPYLKIQF